MEQPAGPSGDLIDSEPGRVVIETAGPPVLNQAAAEVLLRILLRAKERFGMTDTAPRSDGPLRSDS